MPYGVTVASSIAEASRSFSDVERNSGYAAATTATRNVPTANAANNDRNRSSTLGALRHTGLEGHGGIDDMMPRGGAARPGPGREPVLG